MQVASYCILCVVGTSDLDYLPTTHDHRHTGSISEISPRLLLLMRG